MKNRMHCKEQRREKKMRQALEPEISAELNDGDVWERAAKLLSSSGKFGSRYPKARFSCGPM